MDGNQIDTVQLREEKKKLSKIMAKIPSEKAMKTEIMELTHDYNEIKDAAQTVIGALANVKCVTIKSLHKELNLPFN